MSNGTRSHFMCLFETIFIVKIGTIASKNEVLKVNVKLKVCCIYWKRKKSIISQQHRIRNTRQNRKLDIQWCFKITHKLRGTINKCVWCKNIRVQTSVRNPLTHLLHKPFEKFTFCNTFTSLCQWHVNYLAHGNIFHSSSGKAIFLLPMPNIELQNDGVVQVVKNPDNDFLILSFF